MSLGGIRMTACRSQHILKVTEQNIGHEHGTMIPPGTKAANAFAKDVARLYIGNYE